MPNFSPYSLTLVLSLCACGGGADTSSSSSQPSTTVAPQSNTVISIPESTKPTPRPASPVECNKSITAQVLSVTRVNPAYLLMEIEYGVISNLSYRLNILNSGLQNRTVLVNEQGVNLASAGSDFNARVFLPGTKTKIGIAFLQPSGDSKTVTLINNVFPFKPEGISLADSNYNYVCTFTIVDIPVQ
jgi:hypothetical protein